MIRGDLIKLLTDSTGWGPMMYQWVDNGILSAGEILPVRSVGIYLSHCNRKFSGIRYVQVLVGGRVGYIREDKIYRLRVNI
jgi:hypothetical protein